MTTAASWAAIKALFESCVDLPTPAREPLIAAAALDPASLAELRSLLAHHDDATGTQGFLAESAAQQLAQSAARVGQRLGAWEIVRAVGAGGMGEVFEARRADGSYDGRAAVKLLKRGMDSAAVLQRFAQERQALARLNHPHIARLLDAGASAEGLPYFVLEFVDGQPIDEAVRPLALEPRLKLFLQLTEAVAHAHRNLLVHRDLKPGNVLVDTEGQVKLLDFGIAKALDPLEGRHDKNGGHTTVGGVRPYTPNYASPEQVRGEPVSTATDIYSLGVLLYQMLTGTRPTGRNATTPAEAARSVLEDEPTRPSRLSASEAVDPQWLTTRKRLEGDLDNILLKALEKTPERRYASVDALAADVTAFLEGHPVSARPASAVYVLGKFVNRNRWAVSAAALGSVGVATGLAAALLQGRHAAALGVVGLAGGLGLALLKGRQAEVARRAALRHVSGLRQFSREVVVEYGDAITYVPGGMQRKAAMLRTTLGYMQQLVRDGVDDPHFQGEIGAIYVRLADLQCGGNFNAQEEFDEAERNALQAIALFTQAERAGPLDASTSRWWGRAVSVQAKQAQGRGDPARALQLLHGARALLARALQRLPGRGELLSEQASVLQLMAQVHYGWGKPHLNQPEDALRVLQTAGALYEQVVQARQPPVMDDVFQVGTVAGARALILARQERWDDAVAQGQQALQWRQKASLLEPFNRVVAGAIAAERNLLGGLYINSGRAALALEHTRTAWAELNALLSEDPTQQTWLSHRRFLALNHGRALLAAHRADEAWVVLQVSHDWLSNLKLQGQASPLHKRRLAQTQLAQAQALHRLARQPEARALAQAAAADLQALLQSEPQDREHALVLGECACALLAWNEPGSEPGSETLGDAALAPAEGPANAAQAALWRGLARQSYATAHALQALTAEHAQRARELGLSLR